MLERDYDLDALAARNLLDFLREQQDGHARRARATARSSSSASATRSATGACACCRPYGGRVHAAWGAGAVSARIRDELRPRVRRDLVRRRDHRPPPRRRRAARAPSSCCSSPTRSRTRVVGELGGSALFGARFRENAGRALLIPRAYPGKRTPLWQQRLKSQSLLEVAKRYADFPIILETYRECLRDVLDVPGLQRAARARCTAASCRSSRSRRRPPRRSPSSLLFDYVATYMYEGDTPNAERRAAALSLDRDLLRELLGQEELRELIDPDALEQVEADLQHRSDAHARRHARRARRRAAPRSAT